MRAWAWAGIALVTVALGILLFWPQRAAYGGDDHACLPAIVLALPGDPGGDSEGEKLLACRDASHTTFVAGIGLGALGAAVVLIAVVRRQRHPSRLAPPPSP
jgi:hypothetical protein